MIACSVPQRPTVVMCEAFNAGRLVSGFYLEDMGFPQN